MAMYVYKDSSRTDILYAKNAREQNKGIRYYCPNPKCDAHMFIANIDGVSTSYFRATPTHSHVEGCPYRTSNGFDPNEFNESHFDFNNALSQLMKDGNSRTSNTSLVEYKNGKTASKQLRTIRQIYSMCKSYNHTESYNGITVGKMLLDNRSIHMYPKGVFGWRIIETKRKKPKFYDSNKMEISLVVPFTDNYKYTFVLKFDDEILFREIRNVIYNNREHLIIVAGQWESSGIFNIFQTKFLSRKQLCIIK